MVLPLPDVATPPTVGPPTEAPPIPIVAPLLLAAVPAVAEGRAVSPRLGLGAGLPGNIVGPVLGAPLPNDEDAAPGAATPGLPPTAPPAPETGPMPEIVATVLPRRRQRWDPRCGNDSKGENRSGDYRWDAISTGRGSRPRIRPNWRGSPWWSCRYRRRCCWRGRRRPRPRRRSGRRRKSRSIRRGSY